MAKIILNPQWLLSRGCLGILSKFMMNKPPGRRLVIAEINNSFVICWHLLTFSFYSSLLMRTLLGYLSYNIIFVFIEMIKISMFLSFAILNVSSFLQISLILNSRTIHVDDKEDKQNKWNMKQLCFIFIENLLCVSLSLFFSAFHIFDNWVLIGDAI